MINSSQADDVVRRVALKGSTALILAFAVLIIVWLGVYWEHFSVLLTHWNKEDYSHSYLVPPMFVYILWISRNRIMSDMGGSSLPGILVLILAMTLFLMGRLGSLETFVYASMWISLAGVALLILGIRSVKTMFFPFLILGFAIPLPSFLNNMVSFNLKLWSSALAEKILQVLSVPVYREGNIIDLGITQLQVVDACSGLRYLFPTMLMALLVGRFFLSKNWTRILLFAASPLLTLLSNALRIAVTGILVRYFNPELAEGFFHDFSGWLVYMFTLIFLGGITLTLRRIEASEGTDPKQKSFEKDFSHGKNKVSEPVKWKVIMAGTLILFLGWGVQARMVSSQIIPERQDFSMFPSRFENWEGERLYLSQGILDSLWADDYVTGKFHHQDTGDTLQLLISYYKAQTTRKTAHAPTSCLLGGGWMLIQKGLVPPNPGAGRDFPVQSMVLDQGGTRILSNFWFEQRGRLITSEYLNKFYLFWDAMTISRTDGALVRVELYLRPDQSVDEGQLLLDSFLAELRSVLPEYVPGRDI
jgi:exosortase D (VPLPA-CTERM-specific)